MTDDWAHSLLDRTWAEWQGIDGTGALGELKAQGFAVFFSPVPETTPLLILGLNPGGDINDFREADARKIPETHDYLLWNYPLARAMRGLFERMGEADLLKASVKSNLLFFRTPTFSAWRELPAPLRDRLTVFCDDAVREMVDKLRPRTILLEGMSTFDRFRAMGSPGDTFRIARELRPAGRRRVYVSAMRGPTRVIGILHLSGARPSAQDLREIEKALKEDLTP